MLYAVYFNGYWPVGAVGVAHAESEQEAINLMYENLPDELKAKNRSDSMYAYSIDEKPVAILLSGDY